MNIAYRERNKIDRGLFAPNVTTYATPKSVYGSIDSMMTAAALVYGLAASWPSARRMSRDARRIRTQISVVHATLRASPTEEYESATCDETLPEKNPWAFGLLEK